MDFFRRRAQLTEPIPPLDPPKPGPEPQLRPKAAFITRRPQAQANEEPAPEAETANNVEPLEPFMGIKARRFASFRRAHRGDYLDLASKPHLLKLLDKQGDRHVLFADMVLKFTATGKMKRRIMIITIFAIYLIDPETFILRRRVGLPVVEKLYLSKLCDNFLAIIIPTEYDFLIANTRKTEIVTVLVDAQKSISNIDLNVVFKNKFEYNPTAELEKEVIFEEIEGAIKTRILRKPDED